MAVLSAVMRGAIGIGAALVASYQVRRPAWLPGRLVARLMNNSHASVTEWGLSHISIAPDATVLDIGCGGGGTVERLALRASHGRVWGVDYAPASVATARRTNAERIAHGSVEICQAPVSRLPFSAATFDVATAIETHYYWPDLRGDLQEVLRVLKPGGVLAIIAETYRGSRLDLLHRPAMALLGATYLTADEHRALLVAAGYVQVEVFERGSRGWICALGQKPDATSTSAPGN